MNSVIRFSFFLSLLPFIAAAQGQLSFETSKYNFRFIRQGDTVSHAFKFKNTGDKPITITDAKYECVCTSVNYPHDAVMPGDTGSVIITFDSKDTIDRQKRGVKIISDGRNKETFLIFKAIVLKPRGKKTESPK